MSPRWWLCGGTLVFFVGLFGLVLWLISLGQDAEWRRHYGDCDCRPVLGAHSEGCSSNWPRGGA